MDNAADQIHFPEPFPGTQIRLRGHGSAGDYYKSQARDTRHSILSCKFSDKCYKQGYFKLLLNLKKTKTIRISHDRFSVKGEYRSVECRECEGVVATQASISFLCGVGHPN